MMAPPVFNILVLGWYGQSNFGDDLFEHILDRELQDRARCVFVSPESADGILCENSQKGGPRFDLLVVGPGDVINDYFFDAVTSLCEKHAEQFNRRDGNEIVVVGLGIGIPFRERGLELASLFDRILLRNDFEDVASYKNKFGPGAWVESCDDLTVLLLRIPAAAADQNPTRRPILPARVGNHVAFFPARPMLTTDESVRATATLLSELAVWADKSEVHTIPLNCDPLREHENDVVAIEAIRDEISSRNATNTDARLSSACNDVLRFHDASFGARSIEDRLGVFQHLKLAVCMRFHSAQLALLNGVPMVAIGETRKLRLLMERNGLGDFLLAPTDLSGIVAVCDRAVREKDRFSAVSARMTSPSNVATVKRLFSGVIFDPSGKRRTGPLFLSDKELLSRKTAAMHAVDVYLKNEDGVDSSVEWSTHTDRLSEEHQENVARILLLKTTGQPDTSSFWGLLEKMRSKAFAVGLSLDCIVRHWFESGGARKMQEYAAADSSASTGTDAHFCEEASVIRTWLKGTADESFRPIPNFEIPPGNDLAGMHRSGWSFAMRGLRYAAQAVQDQYARSGPSSLLHVDAFADRTFMWCRGALEATGTLPYSKPWIGIFHHVFEGCVADKGRVRERNNLDRLFSQRSFLTSLKCCKCIIVLSRDLERHFRRELDAAGFGFVRTHVITHPTELVPTDQRWSSAKFRANPDRRLVQVGAWLRETYAIYDLALPVTNASRLRKAILKGKDMEGSVAPVGFVDAARRKLNQGEDDAGGPCGHHIDDGGGCSRGANNNSKWVNSLLHNVQRDIRSVEILTNVDNDAYDSLLDRNVVFLKLFGCSATNTVIECLARATPVIVNRHPALEELLGHRYPGFYDSDHEAVLIACDPVRIDSMHAYLAKRDTSKLKLSTFVVTFLQCIW